MTAPTPRTSTFEQLGEARADVDAFLAWGKQRCVAEEQVAGGCSGVLAPASRIVRVVFLGLCVASLVLAVPGCSRAPTPGDGAFLQAPPSARHKRLAREAPEEAVRLYVLGSERIVPFDAKAREVIAARGDAVRLPLLQIVRRQKPDELSIGVWAAATALLMEERARAGRATSDSAAIGAIRGAMMDMPEGFMRAELRQRLLAYIPSVAKDTAEGHVTPMGR